MIIILTLLYLCINRSNITTKDLRKEIIRVD